MIAEEYLVLVAPLEVMDLGLWISLLFILLQGTWVSGVNEERPQLEKEILQSMFLTNKFHTYVRPLKNINQTTDEPLEIFVSLYILNIDIDERNQEFSVMMYFRQEWNDSRLSYDDQDKITALSIHETAGLWTPDLFFVNEKLGYLHALTKPNMFVRIYPEGRVLYSQRLTVKFSCPMNLRKYPFDEQICALPIESYGYTASDLTLKWKPDTTFGTNELSGFRVSFSAIEDVIQTAVHNYSRLQLDIHLTRLIFPQLIHVYIPLTLLVAASWTSFCLKPSDRILRLTIIIITAFATLVFLQSVKEYLYPLCYLTALDVWVGFSCFIIFAAIFENIYAMADHNKEVLPSQMDGISNKKDVPELSNGNKDKRKLTDFLAGKFHQGSTNVDVIARMSFPTVFVLFNVIYVIYYLI